MQKNIKAFTLLELLIVVLIIGILSAMALPQYQKTVFRSKVLGNLPNLTHVKEQIDLYHLANGTYPPDNLKEVMDLEIPGCSGGDGGRYSCNGYGLDYEGWSNPPYIRYCFPSCQDGITKTATLYWYLKTDEKVCSSTTEFCNAIKGIWQN